MFELFFFYFTEKNKFKIVEDIEDVQSQDDPSEKNTEGESVIEETKNNDSESLIY